MTPNGAPEIALCPRCFCPLNVRQYHKVDLLLPGQHPFPPTILPGQGITNAHPASNTAAPPSPPPVYRRNNTPTPPPEPSTRSQSLESERNTSAPPPGPSTRSQSLDSEGNAAASPPGPSTHSQSMGLEEDRGAHGESRRSSASSCQGSNTLTRVGRELSSRVNG